MRFLYDSQSANTRNSSGKGTTPQDMNNDEGDSKFISEADSSVVVIVVVVVVVVVVVAVVAVVVAVVVIGMQAGVVVTTVCSKSSRYIAVL